LFNPIKANNLQSADKRDTVNTKAIIRTKSFKFLRFVFTLEVANPSL